jgi:hypothetical protein
MNFVRGAFAFAVCLLLSGQSMAQLVNGGFETGALPPWTCVPSPGDSCAVTASTAHTGTYAVQAYSNAADGDLSQPLTTVAGSSYTVSAYVRTSSDPINAVRLSIGTNPPFTCATLTSTYALCSATFVAPTNNAPVHLYFKTISGTGTVFIDDVSVTGVFVGAAIPTLGEWALIVMAALLMLTAWTYLRKRLPSP